MAETRKIELELPEVPVVDLQPIHDRISNAEQQLADLRESTAQHAERIKTLADHNPASQEALRLAAEAHQLAQQALKAAQKQVKNADADARKVVAEVPPPPPADPPLAPETAAQPELEHHEPRTPFWKHLL